MIDPEHLNDLSEMTVGHAARAAFLYAAEASGYGPDLFDPLRLDLFSLLVLVKGQECTCGDVSRALCVAADRTADEYVAEHGELTVEQLAFADADPGEPMPTERFVRQAAAALAALTRFETGERVLVGWDRATATPAVIVARDGDDGCSWWVAGEQGGSPWQELVGWIWRRPLTPPLHDNDQPGGAA